MSTQKNIHDSKSQGWIERYMAWSDKTWIQLTSPFAFILLFAVSFNSTEAGVAMALSMVIHELGHAYVLAENGILWKILWLFPLGAVASPNGHEENHKSNQLAWWRLSWLMLAGPATNVALMALGASMVYANVLPIWGGAFITVNGYLLALNLIPLGALDAGQHFKLIFSSLKKKDEVYLMFSIMIILGCLWGVLVYLGYGNMLLAIVKNLGWFGTGVIVMISIFFTSFKDDEAHAESPLAMTHNQVLIATASYFALVFLTLFLWAGLPTF